MNIFLITKISLTLVLLILNILYIYFTSMNDTPITTQNSKIVVLSWVIAVFGFLTCVFAASVPLPFNLKMSFFIIGIILLVIGISGLIVGMNKNEENKADDYNKISSILSIITFFTIGNLSSSIFQI